MNLTDRAPPKKFVTVKGLKMAYVEQGEGRPVIFLHGNPTSSYLWRNVLPIVAAHGRCIALDLLGMGDSDKLPDSGPDSYTFAQQREYVGGALEALGATREVVLVLHDWGSVIGFDWANRRRDAVAGICHMESVVRPVAWSDIPEGARPLYREIRSPAGEKLVLEDNLFIEALLPGAILRKLTDAEMAEYRRPFLAPGESRRAMLTLTRQVAFDGQPPEVALSVAAYSQWLSESGALPKLFINAEPGAFTVGAMREYCRAWPNQTEVTVAGSHFIQEDSPLEVGNAIASWLADLGR